MTDAEKQLIEAVIGRDYRLVRSAKAAVVGERLERNLPGFRDTYKQLVREYRAADQALRNYQDELNRHGLDLFEEDGVLDALRKELNDEQSA